MVLDIIMEVKRKLSKKRIILLCFGIFTLITGVMCYVYFGAEHIQRRIIEKICNKVIVHEAELFEIAENCQDGTYELDYYKDLNDEKIDRLFKDFNILRISKRSDGDVVFIVSFSQINLPLLNKKYGGGFYYSEDDTPLDIGLHYLGKEETLYLDGISFSGDARYWYKTERITDNWWFYETKTVYEYEKKK